MCILHIYTCFYYLKKNKRISLITSQKKKMLTKRASSLELQIDYIDYRLLLLFQFVQISVNITNKTRCNSW